MQLETYALVFDTVQDFAGGLEESQGMAIHQPCRVLIVDDDELVRGRLAAAVRHAGYDVEVANGGQEALRVLATCRCDIVLTDWLMPRMNGLELCRQIRAEGGENYVYLVLFTIRHAQADLMKGFAAGVDDYVVKGTPIDELLSRLETGRRITQHSARHDVAEGKAAEPSTVIDVERTLDLIVPTLRREFDRSERHGRALSVLRCEFDGIDAGSGSLLRELLTLVENTVRKSDWLAQTFDNEFMLVLPETGFAGARLVLAKLQELFAFHLLSSPDGENVKVGMDVMTVNPKWNQGDRAIMDSLLRSVQRRRSAAAADRRNPRELH